MQNVKLQIKAMEFETTALPYSSTIQFDEYKERVMKIQGADKESVIEALRECKGLEDMSNTEGLCHKIIEEGLLIVTE